MRREWIILAVILLVSLAVKSFHYSSHLNFSTDQALFSTRALEIWKQKEITLIGPAISFNYIGRNLFQGPATYYFLLFFLLFGHFDPIVSSYIFTIFACLMIVPLYYGVKFLSDKKVALFVIILYAFLPFYIDYTRFIWNPTFQLSLTPLLILLLGRYKKTHQSLYLFLGGFSSGVLLLFHYQYVIIILGLVFYFIYQKIIVKEWLFLLTGLLLGFSPILLFELRNHFYNTQTLLLYFSHRRQMFSGGGGLPAHYFLSISLFIFILLSWKLRKFITEKFCIAVVIILFIIDCGLYATTPSRGFGMVSDWNYPLEKKANEIIQSENLHDFNVANLGYDTTATVQKYLLKKDNVQINYDDYYKNRYLFVITDKKNFMDNPAYEVHSFKPSFTVKKWQLNEKFQLYLLKRLT